ncbi:transcriptional regulator [Saccharomonospora glauca K62]|uniref:Transcriptional regulator n=2 Tax=Saccharomonospora glauca TaxID=40990 RepID=I1D4S1_9PSEU|nr:transcriptional regulator [Saccharomonospora glauca K62]
MLRVAPRSAREHSVAQFYRAAMNGPERKKYNPENKTGYEYVLLADHLAGLIEKGEWPVGSRIPGERALSEEYGVALDPVRKATRILRERGLVQTLKSKGTFVSPRD